MPDNSSMWVVAGGPAQFCVALAWFVMGVATVLRPRPPKARETERARGWSWGLLLQAISIGLLWIWPRREPPSWPLAVFAALLGAASVAVILASQRALGRQFAYQARIVEGHQLVRTGPYRYVRNPIYTALAGLSLASGLAITGWPLIPISLALYIWGTLIRVRVEERLLRAAFGPEFEEYARRVPAFLPLAWGKP